MKLKASNTIVTIFQFLFQKRSTQSGCRRASAWTRTRRSDLARVGSIPVFPRSGTTRFNLKTTLLTEKRSDGNRRLHRLPVTRRRLREAGRFQDCWLVSNWSKASDTVLITRYIVAYQITHHQKWLMKRFFGIHMRPVPYNSIYLLWHQCCVTRKKPFHDLKPSSILLNISSCINADAARSFFVIFNC